MLEIEDKFTGVSQWIFQNLIFSYGLMAWRLRRTMSYVNISYEKDFVDDKFKRISLPEAFDHRPPSGPVSIFIIPRTPVSVCPSVPNDDTALALSGFQLSAWNVGLVYSVIIKILIENGLLGQPFQISGNFRIIHFFFYKCTCLRRWITGMLDGCHSSWLTYCNTCQIWIRYSIDYKYF